MAPQDDNETLGCSVKDLQDRLRKASPLSVRLLTDSTDRQPLLAIPHREENQVTTDPIHAELTGYPSGTAWLLDTGYTEAGFGGVVYPRQQGEMTWLLNPWIANSDVSQDQIYRHLMSEALVADHLLQDLFEIVEESTGDIDPPQQSVECPLCRLYADQCGETDCAFNRQISRFTAQRVELATLVANEIEQLPNEQQDLFY